MSDLELFSVKFRAEREGKWQQLEAALATLSSAGASSLEKSAAAKNLPELSRELHSSLSVARAISLDRPMVSYLENLASRTALMLNDEQPPLGEQIVRFFTHIWPQTMRRMGWDMLLSALVFFGAALLAYVLFQQDPDWYYAFSYGDERNPSASTEYLAQTIDQSQQDAIDRELEGEVTGHSFVDASAFAAFLFQNNFLVSILALVGGLFFGSLTVALLFFNGLVLGSFFALFASRDLGTDVIGWLSIHGVTELSAIIIAGAGGILIGRTMIFVRGRSMGAALRSIGPEVAAVALAMIFMLGLAAILEGYFRQSVTSTSLRYSIGWGIGALWLAYFLFAGREGRVDEQ